MAPRDEEMPLGDAQSIGRKAGGSRCQLPKVALGLLVAGALVAGAVLASSAASGRRSQQAAAPLLERPLRAFQALAPSAGGRFVEQAIARAPGLERAEIDVRLLGTEAGGTHVTGHLVKVANPLGRVSLALPPGGCGTRELVTKTAMAHHPTCRVAINAGYFNVTDGACIGNVVSGGATVQTVPLAQGNVNFGVRDGKFVIGYLTPEEVGGFQDLVSGVVWLVRDGKNNVERGWAEANITVQTSGKKYATSLASRTAVGWDAAGRLIIIQIDGSIAVGKGRGMNMSRLADELILHGAVNAINLDGGGSSAMARDGVLINYPSDIKPPSCPDASELYQCQRPVSTVLCVHEAEGQEAASLLGAAPGAGAAGPSPALLMLLGAGIFAAGAAVTLLARRMLARGDDDEGFARQLSAESGASSVQPGRA